MKLFASHSKSFAPLWERFFVPSIPKSFELREIKFPQECDNAAWGDEAYWNMMKIQNNRIAQIVAEHKGQVIAFSGCDMMFFGDPMPLIQEHLKRADIVVAPNTPDGKLWCHDFMVIRCNDETIRFRKLIAEFCCNQFKDDHLCNVFGKMIKHSILPHSVFWNLGKNESIDLWTKGQDIPLPPSSMLWFHANWTIGIDSKIALLEGVKSIMSSHIPESFARELPQTQPVGKKKANIVAVMSCPRLGWNDMWGETFNALASLGIPFRRFTGAFWEQCMQNVMEDLIKEDVDIVLTLDYDSVFTAKHVDSLLRHLVDSPEIDAIAALQVKRQSKYPLLTKFGEKAHQITDQPFKVSTAHFGLTAIRMDALRDIPKPWFRGQPDEKGTWRGDERLDADIWFWHQWRLHDRSVYVDPTVRIGHLEVMVSEFDDDMKVRHVHVNDWRESQKLTTRVE